MAKDSSSGSKKAKGRKTVASLSTAADAPDAPSLFRIAGQRFQSGEYDEAVTLYSQANRLAPMNIEITTRLGIAYFKLGQYGKALRCFTTALRVPPKEAVVFTSSYPYAAIFAGIGLVMERQERYEKAIVAYQKAAEIGHPDGEKLRQQVNRLQALIDEKPQFSYSLSIGGAGKKK